MDPFGRIFTRQAAQVLINLTDTFFKKKGVLLDRDTIRSSRNGREQKQESDTYLGGTRY